MRVASSIQGEVVKSRRNSDEVLFRPEHFEQIFADTDIYKKYMYGYLCHMYLTELEKKFSKQRNTIEAYACMCNEVCCACSYCAATWGSQQAADVARTYNPLYDSVYIYRH